MSSDDLVNRLIYLRHECYVYLKSSRFIILISVHACERNYFSVFPIGRGGSIGTSAQVSFRAFRCLCRAELDG